MDLLRALFVIVLAVASQPVLADLAPDLVAEGKEKESDKGEATWPITIRGRVFIRDTFDRINRAKWGNDLDLDSARLTFRYDDKARGLRIEVEPEFGGGSLIRDAYLRYRPNKRWELKAGRFKRPMSGVALASRRELPVAERGLLTDVAVDEIELPVGGRREGVTGTLRLPKEWWRTRITVGAFRGEVHSLPNVDRLAIEDGLSEDLFLRVESRPSKTLTLGSTFAAVPYLSDPLDQTSLDTGLHGSVDLTFEHPWLKLWAEGFIGDSPLPVLSTGLPDELWVGVRGIAAIYIPIADGIGPLVPWGSYQYLDPSTGTTLDGAHESGGGLNLWFDENWRVMTSYRHIIARRRALVPDRQAVTVQIAAVFQ